MVIIYDFLVTNNSNHLIMSLSTESEQLLKVASLRGMTYDDSNFDIDTTDNIQRTTNWCCCNVFDRDFCKRWCPVIATPLLVYAVYLLIVIIFHTA